MNRIVFTNESETKGFIVIDGVEIFGPIPPESSEFLVQYERILAEGVKPESYLSQKKDILPDISDRQFGRGLWEDGIITFEECESFVSIGSIPASLQLIVDSLPDDDTGNPTPRKEAIIFIKGAKLYMFDHPLVDTIRQVQGWTIEHLKERWLIWSTL